MRTLAAVALKSVALVVAMASPTLLAVVGTVIGAELGADLGVYLIGVPSGPHCGLAVLPGFFIGGGLGGLLGFIVGLVAGITLAAALGAWVAPVDEDDEAGVREGDEDERNPALT